ncbi:MAG: carboxypeptidase regulatory-like domain-containing protein [Planctomycetales bacterium]|nr:carboxypeptidase regulatory-like domain-containing protein [Planctomycetales bacterium]
MKSCAAWRLFAFCVFAVLAPLAVGCGGDTMGRRAVDGTVTLDGKPLSHGNVRFEPQQQAAGTSAGAVIADGAFHIDSEQGLPPGVYRVSISCPGVVEANQDADEGGLAEELVPARYNQNTTLEATVAPDGKNHFTFDLTSGDAG